MKDKYLREQLIKTGIIDEDCWGSIEIKYKLEQAFAAGNYHKYHHSTDKAKVEDLKKRLDALIKYLQLEEMYLPEQDASYTFKKKSKACK